MSPSDAPSGFLRLSSNPASGVAEAGLVALLTAEKAEGREDEALSPVPGLAVSQATHLTASGLLKTRHVSHSQVGADLKKGDPTEVLLALLFGAESAGAVVLLSLVVAAG